MATYPPDHQPGMKVPKGGSMCANCKYLGDDQKTCSNDYFIKWNGSDVIPGKIDEYCSDWYEPKEEKTSRSPHGFLPLSALRKEARSEGESVSQERKEQY